MHGGCFSTLTTPSGVISFPSSPMHMWRTHTNLICMCTHKHTTCARTHKHTGAYRSTLASNFPCHYTGDDSRKSNASVIGDHQCPYNSECMFWDSGPYHGIVSFDNVLGGLLVVAQSITLEGWSGIFFLVSGWSGE